MKNGCWPALNHLYKHTCYLSSEFRAISIKKSNVNPLFQIIHLPDTTSFPYGPLFFFNCGEEAASLSCSILSTSRLQRQWLKKEPKLTMVLLGCNRLQNFSKRSLRHAGSLFKLSTCLFMRVKYYSYHFFFHLNKNFM